MSRMDAFMIRPATLQDCPSLEILIAASARGLGAGDYTASQIEAALGSAWGVDRQLIEDATYFVAESEGEIVGCGGWSKRRTLFGSDSASARDSALLNPLSDPARIRAFFVHPSWARRGIATALLNRCESDARQEGFRALELVATLPGVRFYSAHGFIESQRIQHPLVPGLTIEFVAMRKALKQVTSA